MTQLARKQTVVKRARRVVVKIGSSLLSAEAGLDLRRIRTLVQEVAELATDGREFILVTSGACGVWRVIRMHVGAVHEIYRKHTCDTVLLISSGDLRRRSAVYAPGDAHCCPSAYRSTTLRWNGTGWDVLERTTEPA